MKATIDRAALVAALKHVVPAADPRSTMPALGCVLLTLDGTTLTIGATDTNVSASAKVRATGDGGSILVGAGALLRVVERMPGATVTIEQARGEPSATIASGRAKATEPTLVPRDFPKLHQAASPGMAVDASALLTVIESCRPAVCNDGTRFHLNGIMLRFLGDRIVGVATDGHRMHLRAVATACPTASRGVIVPSRALPMLVRLLDGGDVDLHLTTDFLHVTRGDLAIATKLISAQFPPYEQVIPKGFAIAATISAEECAAAVRRGSLATADNAGLLLDTIDDELHVASRDGDRSVSDVVEIERGPATLKTSLAPRYFAEALATFESERIAIHCAGELDPVLLCPAGQEPTEAGGQLVVIMPVRR